MTEMVYTIGHSTHAMERFIALLKLHEVSAVADVRSYPYSTFNPQFSRESLLKDLRAAGIRYVFLGKELGARSTDPRDYIDGRASYELIAASESFKQGLERVLRGSADFRLALMCAEKDPLHCHRTILVSRRLVEKGSKVGHILADGSLEAHDHALARLVDTLRIPPEDMLRSQAQVIEDAYRIQGEAIAYRERDPEDARRMAPTRRAGGAR
jgi:uncharacterized protein (DUF488 family)